MGLRIDDVEEIDFSRRSSSSPRMRAMLQGGVRERQTRAFF